MSILSATRVWAMPHGNTFRIKPIRELVEATIRAHPGVWIDPFANDSAVRRLLTLTNDINPDMPTDRHMDALAFLQSLETDSVDGIIFDPPFSIHQINTVYAGFGDEKPVKQSTRYYVEMLRVLRDGGKVITCGWNSNGMPATLKRDEIGRRVKGKKNTGCALEKLLVVAHGGGHNDTLVCVINKNGDACEFDWSRERKRKRHV